MDDNSANEDKRQKMLSIGESAEYLGISIDTLRRWDKKGKVISHRSPGGHRYFLQKDLDNLFGRKYERVETEPRKQYQTTPKPQDEQETTTSNNNEVIQYKSPTVSESLDVPDQQPVSVIQPIPENIEYYPPSIIDVPPPPPPDPVETNYSPLPIQQPPQPISQPINSNALNEEKNDSPTISEVEPPTKSILEPINITKIEPQLTSQNKQVQQTPAKPAKKDASILKISLISLSIVVVVLAIIALLTVSLPSLPITPIP